MYIPRRAAAGALALLGLAGLLGGCKTGAIRETLDENTYISVITADPPLTFFRLRLDGEFERELMNVGIVERIASAERDTYLWLNLWATRPDGSSASIALGRDVTFQTSRGPLTVFRSADSHTALGLSRPPYPVMRSGAGEGYYRIDAQDIALLGDDGVISAEIDGIRYELWGRQRSAFDALRRYLDDAGL